MIKRGVESNPRIYYWANLLGSISLMSPVMSLFYLHRGLLFSDFFVLLIILVTTMFIFEVPTGVFADRKGPRASMIFGQIISIIAALLLLVAFNRWLFYLISILTGIAISFFSGCDEAFIYDSLKQKKKEKNMSVVWSKIQSALFLPAIVTTILGAIIAKDLLEWQFVLLISIGLLFSLSKLSLLLYLTNPRVHFKKLNRESPFHHIREGIRFIRKTPALLFLFLSETLVLIPIHIFNKFDQPFFVKNLTPVVLIGLIYAINSLISFIVLSNYSKIDKKLSKLTLVWITGLAILLSYIGAVFLNGMFYAIAIFIIIKTSIAIRIPIFSQIKNDYIPSGSRATTLSLLSMIDSALDVFIFISLGSIANLGLSAIFIGCAIIVFIGLLFPVRLKSKRK